MFCLVISSFGEIIDHFRQHLPSLAFAYNEKIENNVKSKIQEYVFPTNVFDLEIKKLTASNECLLCVPISQTCQTATYTRAQKYQSIMSKLRKQIQYGGVEDVFGLFTDSKHSVPTHSNCHDIVQSLTLCLTPGTPQQGLMLRPCASPDLLGRARQIWAGSSCFLWLLDIRSVYSTRVPLHRNCMLLLCFGKALLWDCNESTRLENVFSSLFISETESNRMRLQLLGSAWLCCLSRL